MVCVKTRPRITPSGRRRPPAALAERSAGSTGSTQGVSAVPAPASTAKTVSSSIAIDYLRTGLQFGELVPQTVRNRSQGPHAAREDARMAEWTSTARANASADALLEVLTRPDEIRRWSPVAFDLEDQDVCRLASGTRSRVTGKVAGVRVGFDVEVRVAHEAALELSAEGPVGFDVRYQLSDDERGTELNASVSMRPAGGLTGRLVASATAALLSAGALDGATGRIARVAESFPQAA